MTAFNLNKKNNIIFWGTSDFAAAILNKLILLCESSPSRLSINAVVTRPDEPIGRKQISTPPPVKLAADKYHLPILQPPKLDQNFISALNKFNADLFIVAAYGRIIPATIINLPRFGTLNIHPSLLPKYRGPSPIQTALLNNEAETGVTIIKLDAEMDHGPIINQQLTIINQQDNYQTLSKKLACASADLLISTIPEYLNGQIKLQEQNHAKATFTKLITKQNGLITANKTAGQIFNMWRAYAPWPGIYLESRVKNHELRIKLINVELSDLKRQKEPLQFFIENKNLCLACAGHSTLQIISLQPAGKKIMTAENFINGYLK